MQKLLSSLSLASAISVDTLSNSTRPAPPLTQGSPVIEFDETHDHMSYTNQALLNDIPRVHVKSLGIDEHQQTPKKEHCKLHDWATVHYKAMDKGGNEIVNSRTE
jgi:hypothetical protein